MNWSLFVDTCRAFYRPDSVLASRRMHVILALFILTLCIPVILLNGTCEPSRSASITGSEAVHKNIGRGEALRPTVLPSSSTRPALEADADSDKQKGVLGSVEWRNIGPPTFGGHVTDIAVPDAAGGSVIYAASPGGLFRSVDAGDTWLPLFDGEATSAVNAVAVAPSDPNTVWAGTGFPDFNNTAVIGQGVFRSEDGGNHWIPTGLASTEYIGRIVIDPINPKVVYVATIGSLTHPSQERGIYKTTDSGRHWDHVLFINEWTGAVDLALDPSNANTLYAAVEQRAGSPEGSIDYGPGSGLYKSADAGVTWHRMTSGLPTVPLGRCGISVSRASTNVLYSLVAGAAPINAAQSTPRRWVAVYRSDDHGSSWRRMGTPPATGYSVSLGRIFADPANSDRVYVGGQGVVASNDGGQTFSTLTIPSRDGLADQHAMWIDPRLPAHLIVGNDRGIWISFSSGKTWRHVRSLTLAQCFSVAVDRRNPFYSVYGSVRDHFGYGGPSRTRESVGIPNSAWKSTPAQEIFRVAVDTADNETLYFAGSPGLLRFNTRTEEAVMVGPNEDLGEQPSFLHPWGQVVLSPFDPHSIYVGTRRLWNSRDRGDHWHAISPNLGQARPDSVTLMGIRETDLLQGSFFARGMLTTIAVSSREPGVIYAGTDDGVFAVSRTGGSDWFTRRRFQGVPEGATVSRIVASSLQDGTAYVSIQAVKAGDHRPYLFKTTNYGSQWMPIMGDLPANAAIWVVVEHPRVPRLLFVGTDIGVFASLDGGRHWRSLCGNMPAVSVRDLALQVDANDLVVGTWGRGVFVLDDIAFIEGLAQAERAESVTLFPPREVTEFTPRPWLAADNRPDFATPNPPYGALITFYVPPKLSFAKALIRITERDGKVIRTLTIAVTPGTNRIAWDLRLPPPHAGDDIVAMISPRWYRVAIMKADSSSGCVDCQILDERLLHVVPDALTVTTRAERALEASSRRFAYRLAGDIYGAAQETEQMVVVVRKIRDGPSSSSCRSGADSILRELDEILGVLNGEDLRKAYLGPWPLKFMVEYKGGFTTNWLPSPPVNVRLRLLRQVDKKLRQTVERIRDVRNVRIPSLTRTAGCAPPKT